MGFYGCAVPSAPTVQKLHALLATIIVRVMRLLTRRGLLIEERGEPTLAPIEADPALTSLQVASCTYRIAMGLRGGQKVLSLQSLSSRSKPCTPALYAKAHGFSLHAGLRCSAAQRNELEQLCRYITRPAIANARLSRSRTGQVVLRLKSPYPDGTTHVVMSPLEFLQRFGGKLTQSRFGPRARKSRPSRSGASRPWPSRWVVTV
jgi:Putative transposase